MIAALRTPHIFRSIFRLSLLALVLCGSGCASAINVRIDSAVTTNNGRPFYFMARNVDAQQFLAEDYESAAERLFKYPADESIAESQTIFPGRQASISVPTQSGKDVILYFFFTRPGQKWKVPVHRPLPSEVVVELGRSQIKRVLIRKR